MTVMNLSSVINLLEYLEYTLFDEDSEYFVRIIKPSYKLKRMIEEAWEDLEEHGYKRI